MRGRAGDQSRGQHRQKPVDAENCILEAGADDLWTTAVHIGRLGYDFTVGGPPELIERFGTLARRYSRAVGARAASS
jgi:hypothetical protein